MTGLQTALNFNDFDKLFVGFDRLHNQLANRVTDYPITNYPRYNLVAIGDEAYRIELALPGQKKQDIEIKQHKNELTIEGKEKQELDSNEERYIYKGLSGKVFKRVFTLGDWVEVKDAGFKDGMLVVNLEVNTPESEKPKSIEIGQEKDMQRALRFLNRYAVLRAIQVIIKPNMTTEDVVERSFFTVLILANIFILVYPMMYWQKFRNDPAAR